MEYSKFLEELLPRLNQLESVRKQRLKNFLILSVFTILAPVLGIILIRIGQNSPLVLSGALLLVFGILLVPSIIPWGIYRNKDFGTLLKTNLNDLICKAAGELKPDKDLEMDFSKSGLFARYNKALADDKFRGKYNSVAFEIFEGMIPPFRGVVFAFKSNKKIKNRTILISKNDISQKNSDLIRVWIPIMIILSTVLAFSINGEFTILKALEYFLFCSMFFALFYVIGILGTQNINREALNKINMEDVEFCRKFDVYSSDEVEARYLATPAFIERFQSLKTVFGAKKIKCAFYEDKVMFAISTSKDLFEIGNLFTPLENPEKILNFYKQITAIPEMIDYFKLDEKTGL